MNALVSYRPPHKHRLPTALTHDEARAILAQVRNPVHRASFQVN
jgi:hypothetical protein